MGFPIEVLNNLDDSSKQLYIFYLLCKAGVVKFDLSIPKHEEYLKLFIQKAESYNPKDYELADDFIKITAKNNHMIFSLILVEIMKNLLGNDDNKI